MTFRLNLNLYLIKFKRMQTVPRVCFLDNWRLDNYRLCGGYRFIMLRLDHPPFWTYQENHLVPWSP